MPEELLTTQCIEQAGSCWMSFSVLIVQCQGQIVQLVGYAANIDIGDP